MAKLKWLAVATALIFAGYEVCFWQGVYDQSLTIIVEATVVAFIYAVITAIIIVDY